MQHGAGEGRKKCDARIPSVQRGLFASAALTILNGSDRGPANFHRCNLAFLPGSGLRVECDVTYSKQTSAPFLPGSRIAPHGLRQGTAFHAELRSAAAPNASQSSGVHTLVAEATPEVRCHARTSIANALSNRELQLLEPRLIHRKQTIAPRSNRELSTKRCRVNSHRRVVCIGGGCCKAPIGRLAVPRKTRSGDERGLLWPGEKAFTIGGREILVQGRGVPSRMGRLC
jgi:hypothetical protein